MESTVGHAIYMKPEKETASKVTPNLCTFSMDEGKIHKEIIQRIRMRGSRLSVFEGLKDSEFEGVRVWI